MITKTIIVYHKDCMDGLGSAFIWNKVLTKIPDIGVEIFLLPLQHSKEDELFQLKLDKETLVCFADFSLKRDKLLELADKVNCVYIYDHHKTAKDGLIDLPDNVNVTFDMEKSGVMISYDAVRNYVDLTEYEYIFKYIQDRDLWKWELPDSKEISAYLNFVVKPNDVLSFEEMLDSFNVNEAISIGKVLLENQKRQVESKVKKAKTITLDRVTMMAVNATENISEIGNVICDTYSVPALMFFITEDFNVVCSLRSKDELADVSKIATVFGGGGHRNACGFTTTIRDLESILLGAYK